MAGVRYRDAEGDERELRAPLVVGADGRRSLVGREVGADDPELANENGRGCYFAYWRDARPEWRGIAAQWRSGEELVTAFPCDGGLLLVLLMPPVDRAGDFKGDLDGRVRAHGGGRCPELAERLEGCERATKVRHTPSTPCRTSAAPPARAGRWPATPATSRTRSPRRGSGTRCGSGGSWARPWLRHWTTPRALDRGAARVGAPPRPGMPRGLPVGPTCIGRAETMNPHRGRALPPRRRRPAARHDLPGRLLTHACARRSCWTARRFARLTARALIRGESDRSEVLRVAARELRLAARHGLQRLWLRLGGSMRRSRREWRGPESNRRHHDFQSCALPTELPRQARAW